MFVKIVRNEIESVYECDRYTKKPYTGDPTVHGPADVRPQTHIEMEGSPSQNIGVIYANHDTDVYIMNSSGETIETHRYPRGGSAGFAVIH